MTFQVDQVWDCARSVLGRLKVTQHPLGDYRISDLDDAGATKYYGFVKDDGSWYIMQLTATAARYTKGDSDYTTNWTGRAGLTTYDYFYTTF